MQRITDIKTLGQPGISRKMAMKIGGKYDPDKVFLRHWHRLVPDTGVARKALEKKPSVYGHDNSGTGRETH